ncbi:MAG: alpha/beta hydrolase [Planctomycetaceae bacterium]|nr:alpha/beta hydrolase [Planctomycetaceae bacterium]
MGDGRLERIVEHRGCRLSYSVAGNGSPVLFIQGVGVQGAGWKPQTAELVAAHTCLWFDNRGMSRSQPVGAEITVSQMAEDARAVLDAESIPAAHVVGHSLGGLVALRLALDAPERVRSLSLLCTFTGSRTAAPLTLRMMWLGLRARVGTRSMRRRGFLRLVLAPGATANADALAELFGHDLADQPPVVAAQLRALRACDLSDQLAQLASLPTLVVNAAHDPIAPPRAGRALRDGLKGARYVEIPDASHGLPITHAARVNGLLREHFTAVDAASGDRLR